MSDMRIAFIGTGNMVFYLIGGALAKDLNAVQIRASDPNAETRTRVASEHDTEMFYENLEAVQNSDVIVIAVKPRTMRTVRQDLHPSLKPHQLLISIFFRIICDRINNWLGNKPRVRCIPNTPALRGKGASSLYATPAVTAEQHKQAEDLLSAIGTAVWADTENQIDAVTALSGSSPACFLLLIGAMIDAGVKLGLPHAVVERLTEQTILGTAHMAVGEDVGTAELRRRITSPAGTTQAVIKSFRAGGFETTVERALSSATHWSAAMAKQLGQ